MNIVNLIERYVENNRNAWAATTQETERHRLRGIVDHINGNADHLWESIQQYSPYGRLTLWTRVVKFWQFLIDEGVVTDGKNPYKAWREKNARVFKNVYIKRKPEISFEEAVARIQSIDDQEVKEVALQILQSGLRISESSQVNGGSVVGKGNRRREVYGTIRSKVSHSSLRRKLRQIGLKPHDLRKLFLSRIVELGANEFELMEIAGWSSLTTASSYIKTNQARIKSLVGQLQRDVSSYVTKKQVSGSIPNDR